MRRKLIVARNDAEVGDVFGYEAVAEDRSVFTQFEWHFQHHLPVLLSRYALTLPTGWRAESVTFNHTRIEPAIAGSSTPGNCAICRRSSVSWLAPKSPTWHRASPSASFR